MVGNAGVGKSTFVQNALGLPFPLPSEAAERMIPLEGGTYLVRLLELSIDDVDLDEDGTFTWPDTIGDKSMPRVDGAITLWDVTDKDSLEDIPEMLSKSRDFAMRHLAACQMRRHAVLDTDPLQNRSIQHRSAALSFHLVQVRYTTSRPRC